MLHRHPRQQPLALWKDEAAPEDIAYAREYLGLNDGEGFNWGPHPGRHELRGYWLFVATRCRIIWSWVCTTAPISPAPRAATGSGVCCPMRPRRRLLTHPPRHGAVWPLNPTDPVSLRTSLKTYEPRRGAPGFIRFVRCAGSPSGGGLSPGSGQAMRTLSGFTPSSR